MFASGWWYYMVPTHWSIVPDSIRAVGTYLHFQLPAKIPGQPYEPAQKLAYFVVVFLLAPFQIATGAAMSPAVLSRFPRYGKLFGGKQGARSLHFLGLVAFAAFVLLHTVLVVIHGLPAELTVITLGSKRPDHGAGLAIGLGIIAVIVLVQMVATMFSLRHKRRTQHLLGKVVDPLERLLSRGARSRQHYPRRKISPYFRVNGYPPADPAYDAMVASGFADYRLSVGGLVEQPVTLSSGGAAGARRAEPDHRAQLHPGLDGDRRVERRAARPAGRAGQAATGGAVHRLLRHGRQGADRRARGPVRLLLRQPGHRAGVGSPDDPGGRDERRAAVGRTRGAGAAPGGDPAGFQDGQVAARASSSSTTSAASGRARAAGGRTSSSTPPAPASEPVRGRTAHARAVHRRPGIETGGCSGVAHRPSRSGLPWMSSIPRRYLAAAETEPARGMAMIAPTTPSSSPPQATARTTAMGCMLTDRPMMNGW